MTKAGAWTCWCSGGVLGSLPSGRPTSHPSETNRPAESMSPLSTLPQGLRRRPARDHSTRRPSSTHQPRGRELEPHRLMPHLMSSSSSAPATEGYMSPSCCRQLACPSSLDSQMSNFVLLPHLHIGSRSLESEDNDTHARDCGTTKPRPGLPYPPAPHPGRRHALRLRPARLRRMNRQEPLRGTA